MERLIKNVKKSSWMELKAEAAKHDMRIGEFLEYLVEEHKKIENEKKTNWDIILKGRKTLSNSEAEELKRKISIFEKIYGFEE